MAAVLPGAELDQVAQVLAGIPGFDGSVGRRHLLRLLGTAGPGNTAVPDHAVEAGWRQVLDYLAQPPAFDAFARLRTLLTDLRQVAGAGDAEAALIHAEECLATLAANRSFRVFLARIGVQDEQADSSGVALVDRAFVPPAQYKRALEVLEREHVVCLFGDPHMGKTYCAIRLLWDYFSQKGYEPYWQHVSAPLGDRPHNLSDQLREGAILYIEDPFGRTGPAEDIDLIIHHVRLLILDAKKRNVRVVITSRSAVFKTAVADKLNPFIVTLSQELLIDQSYDEAALEQITGFYISNFAPLWARDGDRATICHTVAEELAAPHNIKEFIEATRREPDLSAALARLADFRDIIREFATVFGKMDDWLLDALLLITAAGDIALSPDELAGLYDGLQPRRAPYRSFPAAVRSLGDYVTVYTSGPESQLLQPRHPSLGEGLEALTRRDESRLEATWLLVELCRDRPAEKYGLVAIRLLANYADRWATEPHRLELLAEYFESTRLDVRTWSRRAILNRFDDVSQVAAGVVVDLAQRSWGDRYLAILIFQPSQLDDERYTELALRLADSNDAQTRFFLANWIGGLLRPPACAAISDALLKDPDGIVRRTAIIQMIKHSTLDEAATERLIQAARELPPRHQRWIMQMADGLRASPLPSGGAASAVTSALAGS